MKDTFNLILKPKADRRYVIAGKTMSEVEKIYNESQKMKRSELNPNIQLVRNKVEAALEEIEQSHPEDMVLHGVNLLEVSLKDPTNSGNSEPLVTDRTYGATPSFKMAGSTKSYTNKQKELLKQKIRDSI